MSAGHASRSDEQVAVETPVSQPVNHRLEDLSSHPRKSRGNEHLVADNLLKYFHLVHRRPTVLLYGIRVASTFQAAVDTTGCRWHHTPNVRSRASRSQSGAGPAQHTGGVQLPVTYEDLTQGHEFPPVEYVLDAGVVAAYVEAVGATERRYVPPLAVAARAIASLGGLIELLPGTIHAAQEFEFSRLIPVGSRVKCVARVLRKLSRGPVRMLTLEMTVTDEAGMPVQQGRSTIVLPGA
jgi:hypothetical protein